MINGIVPIIPEYLFRLDHPNDSDLLLKGAPGGADRVRKPAAPVIIDQGGRGKRQAEPIDYDTIDDNDYLPPPLATPPPKQQKTPKPKQSKQKQKPKSKTTTEAPNSGNGEQYPDVDG